MAQKQKYCSIPTRVSLNEFNKFILPHLAKGKRGPGTKITFFKIFNYILKLIHTGCQWSELPIDKDQNGRPELHYTNVFRKFQDWNRKGCFNKVFVFSVAKLFSAGLLDLSVIHGDGSSTCAKKGVII